VLRIFLSDFLEHKMTYDTLYLNYAYSVNDEVKAEEAAARALVDGKRMEMLKDFQDAQLIVTQMRILEDASGGRLRAQFHTRGGGSNRDVEIVISDVKVADRALSVFANNHDKNHGYRFEINQSGVLLKPVRDEGYFFPEIKGAHEALCHVFAWAGSTKDEDGKFYLQRPSVVGLPRPDFKPAQG
jgi:hypothetical protein